MTDKTSFVITLSFLDPVEGMVYVMAEDQEEALAIVSKLYSNRQSLKIVDVRTSEDEDLLSGFEPTTKEKENAN